MSKTCTLFVFFWLFVCFSFLLQHKRHTQKTTKYVELIIVADNREVKTLMSLTVSQCVNWRRRRRRSHLHAERKIKENGRSCSKHGGRGGACCRNGSVCSECARSSGSGLWQRLRFGQEMWNDSPAEQDRKPEKGPCENRRVSHQQHGGKAAHCVASVWQPTTMLRPHNC